VCGLKRQLRASVEHAHSAVASIRKLNAANTRTPACHQFAAREDADRLLKRPVGWAASKVRWGRAHLSDRAPTPRRPVAKVRCDPVELCPQRRFYRHSRHLAGGAVIGPVALSPAINMRQVDR